MNYRNISKLVVATVMAVTSSCGSKDTKVSTVAENGVVVETPYIEVHTLRLDSIAANYKNLSPEGREAVITQYEAPLKALLAFAGATEVDDRTMSAYSQSRAVEMFTPENLKAFKNMAPVDSSLSALYTNLSRLLPEVERPEPIAVVLPYNQSVVIVDSMMFVGLNHYLGSSHPAYNGFPDYVRTLKRPDRISFDIAEALVTITYPQPEGLTALGRMLYEGAIVEAVIQLTGATEAEALGYDEGQYSRAKADEGVAWETLMTRRLLFSTDPTVGDRLLRPAPSTSILNGNTPGRLGRFIGHRIVASWLKNHPEATLESILKPEFSESQRTLQEAQYAP